MLLSDPTSVLPKTHSTTLKKLGRIGIHTIGDLILYLPTRYVDYSVTSPIGQVQAGEVVTVSGVIKSAKTRYVRRSFTIQEVVIEDGTGELKLVWFNQPYIVRNTQVGVTFAAAGTAEMQGTKLIMKPKEYEIITNYEPVLSEVEGLRITNDQKNEKATSTKPGTSTHTGRIVPVYSERGGLSSRLLREKIGYILQQTEIEGIEEWLPTDIIGVNNLTPYQEAVKVAHNPKTVAEAQKARNRFAFDELFTLHLANSLVRKEWHRQKVIKTFSRTDKIKQLGGSFVSSLPFTLTKSQQKAWEEVRNDMLKPHPMNRFLQGDVGSGKTVVAALAAYLTHLNGYRTLFMCPTEILAQQHFATLQKMFAGTNVTISLITGSNKSTKCKVQGTKHLKSVPHVLHADVVIGTHALISDKHSFENVGLVIIDEQHRFGVAQRAILKEKSSSKTSAKPTSRQARSDTQGSPHLLTMTATPIPRTLALTLFGDLDLSVLSDMPMGRLPIRTYLAPPSKRQSAYAWIEKQVTETGCQVFVVCPRITNEDEEDTTSDLSSEAVAKEETTLSLKAVESEAELLQKDIFPNLKIGLLHGKMKSKEKDEVMQKFKQKEYDILVTTTVVEVGIDIPNATIIVIEGAERYGLAQLHQLRGRVGRSNVQSYCVLFTTDGVNQTERLTFFAKTNDGMELAEYDFRHRGPGDIYGTSQHGAGELQVANLFDYELVSKTQKAAAAITTIYSPKKYPLIAKRLERYTEQPIAKD